MSDSNANSLDAFVDWEIGDNTLTGISPSLDKVGGHKPFHRFGKAELCGNQA